MDDIRLVFVRSGEAFGAVSDVSLDLAFGDEENSFTLTLNDSHVKPQQGDLWMIDGTEYGGVVDSVESSVADGAATVTYSGRSLQGLLAYKVLEPDSGDDYLTVSGNIVTVLETLIERVELEDVFEASSEISESYTVSSYKFERYVDAYTGLRDLLGKNSMKLRLQCRGNKVLMGAEALVDYTDILDSDLMGFTATREFRRTNHLIGLGEGELKDRIVVHYYADEDGNVSTKQSLFGVDEVAEVYDYSNADEEQLTESTEEKLEEIQEDNGTVDVTVNGEIEFDIDDIVTARDNVSGVSVTASVSKKILTIEDGLVSLDYEIGQQTTSLSDTAEVLGTMSGVSTDSVSALSAASVLSAYPVGAVFLSTADVSPSESLGGEWTELESSLPCRMWERTG